MSDSSRRELARFLRSRRERIRPADVGLPVGPRRRSAGLRREEVAVLAGVSPTWYTYLEQGRNIHPSVEVLDSLARVLNLTEDERRYLHVLALGHVQTPSPLVGELSGEEIVRLLVLTTESWPYPVYAVNLYCDVIAWNPAAATYYTDFGRLPEGKCNILRWLLESPQAKQRLPDWSEDTRDVIARWRAMTASYGEGDARVAALVAEFARISPEFCRWWETYEVREHRTRIRRLRHPRLGVQRMRLIVVQAADFAPCVAVFHLLVPGEDKPTSK
jgi:transcriptional regulator with XRE-family HTH domain